MHRTPPFLSSPSPSPPPRRRRILRYPTPYDAYAMVWKAQQRVVDKLPVHFRGELLGGLAQAAQQWKSDPAAVATTKLTCKNCHNPGRLAAQLEALKQ